MLRGHLHRYVHVFPVPGEPVTGHTTSVQHEILTERILEDIGLPWGHHGRPIAVMFQIVCALALEVPSVLLDIESLHGMSPNVILSCKPWGHMDHSGGGCECLSSDSTGAYVHNPSLVMDEAPSAEAREDLSSVHRSASWLAQARGAQDRCPLCLIGQGLTAG